MNIPPPIAFTNLPEGSNSRIGSKGESAHDAPPQRSPTQMFPFGSIANVFVDPHCLPAGRSFPQPSTRWYGLGREFVGETSWADALPPKTAHAAIPAMANVNFK